MSYEECEKHGVDVTNERCIECLAEAPPTTVSFLGGTAMFCCDGRYCSACRRPTFDMRGGICGDFVLNDHSVVFCRGCLERLLQLATDNE